QKIDQHDYTGAIADLDAVMISSDIYTDLARLYLAKAFTGLGDSATAAAILSNAKVVNYEHGGRIIRLDSEYSQIARDVADAEGAEIVDATPVLDADPSVFFDF